MRRAGIDLVATRTGVAMTEGSVPWRWRLCVQTSRGCATKIAWIRHLVAAGGKFGPLAMVEFDVRASHGTVVRTTCHSLSAIFWQISSPKRRGFF